MWACFSLQRPCFCLYLLESYSVLGEVLLYPFESYSVFGEVLLYPLESCSAFGDVFLYFSSFRKYCFCQMDLAYLVSVLHRILALSQSLRVLLISWRWCSQRFLGFWPEWLYFSFRCRPYRWYGRRIQLASLWVHKLLILLILSFILLCIEIHICWSQGSGGVGRLSRPDSASLWN